jgi:hypothetical protein
VEEINADSKARGAAASEIGQLLNDPGGSAPKPS